MVEDKVEGKKKKLWVTENPRNEIYVFIYRGKLLQTELQ